MKANWNGKAVVEMLRDFGLSEYEARIYFVSLTIGEAKVGTLAKKARVPQSKGYEVLDRLIEKGFVEQISRERPQKYKAKSLEKVMLRAIAKQKRFIKRLNSNFESLKFVLRAIGPVYEKYGMFRLFSPIFSQRDVWIRMSLPRPSMHPQAFDGASKDLRDREVVLEGV